MATDYAARVSISLVGDERSQFFTHSGALLATCYRRVVVGGRGPYVEFECRHLDAEALYEADDRHFYYVELRSNVDNVKVYAQLRSVDYADYVPGMFYVSPFELCDRTGKALIEPLKPPG